MCLERYLLLRARYEHDFYDVSKKADMDQNKLCLKCTDHVFVKYRAQHLSLPRIIVSQYEPKKKKDSRTRVPSAKVCRPCARTAIFVRLTRRRTTLFCRLKQAVNAK